ncbi:hypothetical protein ACFU7X_17500, partial [Streptomyces chartreusis]
MGIRDRALVLMHVAVPGREHELAVNRVRDYVNTPAGIQPDLRVFKIRPRTVAVCDGSRLSICPVRAWIAWKEAAGLDDPDGYAWRSPLQGRRGSRPHVRPDHLADPLAHRRITSLA